MAPRSSGRVGTLLLCNPAWFEPRLEVEPRAHGARLSLRAAAVVGGGQAWAGCRGDSVGQEAMKAWHTKDGRLSAEPGPGGPLRPCSSLLCAVFFPSASSTGNVSLHCLHWTCWPLYYNGKKDHHKRVTTERPHPTGGSCPREGHGKGKLIRILFSVDFGGFRG